MAHININSPWNNFDMLINSVTEYIDTYRYTNDF